MTDDTIIQTFETQTGQKVRSIRRFENVANNAVYKIETDAKPYIFKIYAKRDWPEDGKLQFISRKLDEINIPHAKILTFTRNDANFPNGCLIEECLPGTTADRLALSPGELSEMYHRLAAQMSRVHRIKMQNFGYTGDGSPAIWPTFSECMYDVMLGDTPRGPFDDSEFETAAKQIRKRLEPCDKFPSVLCHGDLSAKNILVNNNDITLIDWDDAQSLCWMADAARLTFWMKLEYGDTAAVYRKTFLDSYETAHGKDAYYELEDILHVWYGIEYCGWFYGKSQHQHEKTKALLRKSLKNCGMSWDIFKNGT